MPLPGARYVDVPDEPIDVCGRSGAGRQQRRDDRHRSRLPHRACYTVSMHYDAVMFDLDGTLADTLRDIAEAGNYALTQLGHAALPVARYRYLAGQGLPYLVRHALGPDHAGQIEAGIAHFRSHYDRHRYDHTGLFAGIAELLDALVEADAALAVLSNKPHDATLEMVDKLFARWRWSAVAGARADVPLKPDAGAARMIATELNIGPERWVYVGDTMVDMQTGRSAGMFTVGVTWGFRDEAELREHGADAIIHRPGELLPLLDGQKQPSRAAHRS
ncbi:MAG: HAD family hydrolase [Phycisphaeraceae bacterium]